MTAEQTTVVHDDGQPIPSPDPSDEEGVELIEALHAVEMAMDGDVKMLSWAKTHIRAVLLARQAQGAASVTIWQDA